MTSAEEGGAGRAMQFTELDSSARADQGPSSTNTRFIYTFRHNGRLYERILTDHQAQAIRKIFHTINQKLQNPVSEDVSSLKGRVTAINFVADLIEREADGKQESISLSSLQGGNQWYEPAVKELVEIVRGKMVGSSSLEDRTFHRSDAPKGAEVTNFCSIPGRFFGSTPIDLSHFGCTKGKEPADYLETQWFKNKADQPIDEVFTSELKIITKYAKKQYRNQPLTREMEKECKIEARSRAVAVELLRTGSDEARIALFMKLTSENQLPCDDQFHLRTPLDHAMAQKYAKRGELDTLTGVTLVQDPVSNPEEQQVVVQPEIAKEALPVREIELTEFPNTDRRKSGEEAELGTAEIPAQWWADASSGGGGLFSGLWNWISSGRSDPEAADWLRTGKNAMVEGLKGKAMSEDVDPADGFELAGLPDLRSNLATDLRGSIVGLENADVANNKWTEFVIKGQAEEPLLQAMRNAASEGAAALKGFLTKVLDESSTCKPDLLIHYLNQAVKEAPGQTSKFKENSLVAVLKDAWGRGPGPSESIKNPDIANSKQVKAFLSREGFDLTDGASGFGGK
jgi:hypothetical protein